MSISRAATIHLLPLAMFVMASPAGAQRDSVPPSVTDTSDKARCPFDRCGSRALDQAARGTVLDIGIEVVRSTSALGGAIGDPVGVGARFVSPLGSDSGWIARTVAARVDGFWVRHGDEERIRSVTYHREFAGALVGLQLTFPFGPVRPYASASAGTTVFFVSRDVECSASAIDCEPGREVSRSDWEATSAWMLGTYLHLGDVGDAQLTLNLGYGGRDSGTPGSVTLTRGGSSTPGPAARYHVWQIGIGVGRP